MLVVHLFVCVYACARNVILIRSVQLHHCFPHRALNSDKITENNIANIFSTHPKLMEFIFKPQNRASPPHLFKCPMHGLPASSSKYGSKPLHWPPSFHLSCWLQVLVQGPRQSDTCPWWKLTENFMSPKEMAMNHPKCLNRIPLPKLFFFSQLIKLCVEWKTITHVGRGGGPIFPRISKFSTTTKFGLL